jgi:MtN3 and saliva related transmembrane protein
VTTPEILAVVATLAGFAMALSPTLQIRRMRRTRSSRDVSLLYLSMLDLGFVAWISYGWSIGNWALILSNTASLTIMSATILVALRFRRHRESILEPAPGTPLAAPPIEVDGRAIEVDGRAIEEVSESIDR